MCEQNKKNMQYQVDGFHLWMALRALGDVALSVCLRSSTLAKSLACCFYLPLQTSTVQLKFQVKVVHFVARLETAQHRHPPTVSCVSFPSRCTGSKSHDQMHHRSLWNSARIHLQRGKLSFTEYLCTSPPPLPLPHPRPRPRRRCSEL